MTDTGLPGSSLRERQHLQPFTVDECERRSAASPPSRTLRTPDFPGLGPVDVVLARPRALVELKWSYMLPGKVFESAWDMVKLALVGERLGYPALYIATGAATVEWEATESA